MYRNTSEFLSFGLCPVTLRNLFIGPSSFLVGPFGIFLHIDLCPLQRERFTSSFSISIAFISFSFLMALARTSSAMLNNRVESRLPVLFWIFAGQHLGVVVVSTFVNWKNCCFSSIYLFNIYFYQCRLMGIYFTVSFVAQIVPDLSLLTCDRSSLSTPPLSSAVGGSMLVLYFPCGRSGISHSCKESWLLVVRHQALSASCAHRDATGFLSQLTRAANCTCTNPVETHICIRVCRALSLCLWI